MKTFEKARRVYRERSALKALANNYLVFSQALDRSVWGSVAEEDRRELVRLVKVAGQYPGPIIEIGTLFGFSTQLLAEEKRPDQTLISVDNYSWNPFCLPPEHHREFTRNALHYCIQNAALELYDGSSLTFFDEYSQPAPAMVFLDGSHEYEFVVEEIRHAKRLGAAIICGDDYNAGFPGVIRAVDEELGDELVVNRSVWSATIDRSSDVR